MPPSPSLALLVGNPSPGSRTAALGLAAARRLEHDGPGAVVEVADLGARLLGADAAEDPAVRRAWSAVAGARRLVVATPVYKSSVPGLLKLFLDGFSQAALAGVVAVPVVLSAAPAHGVLAEQHLRVVLEALGATVADPSLVLGERDLDDRAGLDARLDAWAGRVAA
jgi:FMN reductase